MRVMGNEGQQRDIDTRMVMVMGGSQGLGLWAEETVLSNEHLCLLLGAPAVPQLVQDSVQDVNPAVRGHLGRDGGSGLRWEGWGVGVAPAPIPTTAKKHHGGQFGAAVLCLQSRIQMHKQTVAMQTCRGACAQRSKDTSKRTEQAAGECAQTKC